MKYRKTTPIEKKGEFQRNLNYCYNDFMADYEGDTSVGIFGTNDLEETKKNLIEDGWAPSTVQIVYNRIKKEEKSQNKFEKELFNDWIKENPKEYKRVYGKKRGWFGNSAGHRRAALKGKRGLK